MMIKNPAPEFAHRTRHDTTGFAHQARNNTRATVVVVGDDEPLPDRAYDVPHRITAGCLGHDLEVA